jgi:nucleotide-binding universal stress UspA family protein
MMPTPKTRGLRSILCAVDFSPHSAKALRYAATVAAARGGRLTAIHVVDPLLAAAAAYDSRLIEQTAQADLARFVRTSLGGRAGAAIRCVAQAGAPGPAVLAYARRTRASVIVMGTHGRRGAAKVFFGSTMEAVLRRFRGPVLAIPPGCREPRPGWPGGSIIAAVGEGPHHRASLSAAARVAEVFGVWLSVAPATPATARQRGTGMIVLPLPPAARLQMLRQGSAAYRFIRGARCPVLVVRVGTRIGTIIQPSRAA